jgi:hypothetical protein
MTTRTNQRRAQQLRQRAHRLSYDAETIADHEIGRDVSGERDRLRGAAANADQRASVVEQAAGWRPWPTGRRY